MNSPPVFDVILERAQELERTAPLAEQPGNPTGHLFAARLFRAFVLWMNEDPRGETSTLDVIEALRDRARTLATSGCQDEEAEDGWDPGAPYRFASQAFRDLADALEAQAFSKGEGPEAAQNGEPPFTREEAARLVEECANDLESVQKEYGGPYGGLSEVKRMPKSKVAAIRRVAEVIRGTRADFFAPPLNTTKPNTSCKSPCGECERLRDWQAGAIGAAAISYPVRTGPHTEEAFVAHREAYLCGSEDYRSGADVVSSPVNLLLERIQEVETALSAEQVRAADARRDHVSAMKRADASRDHEKLRHEMAMITKTLHDFGYLSDPPSKDVVEVLRKLAEVRREHAFLVGAVSGMLDLTDFGLDGKPAVKKVRDLVELAVLNMLDEEQNHHQRRHESALREDADTWVYTEPNE